MNIYGLVADLQLSLSATMGTAKYLAHRLIQVSIVKNTPLTTCKKIKCASLSRIIGPVKTVNNV